MSDAVADDERGGMPPDVGQPDVGQPDVEQPDVEQPEGEQPEADQPGILRLPAILDLKAASPLAARLLERRNMDLVVDASAVQRLGGQCLQVLLAAQADWAADMNELSFENASPEFCAAIELFGAGSIIFSNEREPA